MKLAGRGQWFDSWNNGDVNAFGAAPVHKIKVPFVVEKHLRDDVLGTMFNFLFQPPEVAVWVGVIIL